MCLQTAGSPVKNADSGSAAWSRGQRVRTSNELPGDPDAAGPRI